MKRLVIDTSVVLKWYFADEAYSRGTLELLDRYISNEVEFIAPSLLEYEVLNGLLVAKKRGRVEREKVMMAVEGFLGLEIEKQDVSSFFPKVVYFSETYNLSAYDASYLAVADREGVEFITADQDLYAKVKKDLKWVKWICS